MELDGIPTDADDFAAQLLAALKAPTSHVRGHPVISENDARDVLIDGSFDLVAVARHLADALRRDLDELRKVMKQG